MTDSHRYAHRDVEQDVRSFDGPRIMQAVMKPTTDIELAYVLLSPTSPLFQIMQAKKNAEYNLDIMLRDLHKEQAMTSIREQIENTARELTQLFDQLRQEELAMAKLNAEKRGQTEKMAAGNPERLERYSEGELKSALFDLTEKLRSLERQLTKIMEKRAELNTDWAKNREKFAENYIRRLKEKMTITSEQEEAMRKTSASMDIVTMMGLAPELAKQIDLQAKSEAKTCTDQGHPTPQIPTAYAAAARSIDMAAQQRMLAIVLPGDDPDVLQKRIEIHGTIEMSSLESTVHYLAASVQSFVEEASIQLQLAQLSQLKKGLSAMVDNVQAGLKKL